MYVYIQVQIDDLQMTLKWAREMIDIFQTHQTVQILRVSDFILLVDDPVSHSLSHGGIGEQLPILGVWAPGTRSG